MKKSIKQWYNDLPAGYRELALRSLSSSKPYTGDDLAKSLYEALDNGFVWAETPEGYVFWEELVEGLENSSPLDQMMNFPLETLKKI